MNIFITRFYKYIINGFKPYPKRCHAFKYLQYSLFDTCDCEIWCKYPENDKKIRY